MSGFWGFNFGIEEVEALRIGHLCLQAMLAGNLTCTQLVAAYEQVRINAPVSIPRLSCSAIQ
jgi:hypothetical protein